MGIIFWGGFAFLAGRNGTGIWSAFVSVAIGTVVTTGIQFGEGRSIVDPPAFAASIAVNAALASLAWFLGRWSARRRRQEP